MRRFSIRPILAVVPENHDRLLAVDVADENFWNHMRALEGDGWTIAMHGLWHDCHAYGKSLVPLHHRSEFAGVSAEGQLWMLECGVSILRSHGLSPTVWVAPRHGFDGNTLEGLKEVGIFTVSDGLSRYPFRKNEILWIPQQLWGGREMPDGVWTICLHANTISDNRFRELELFLERHHAEFLSVEEVEQRWGNRRKHLFDVVEGALRLRRLQGKKFAGRGIHPLRGAA